MSAGRNSNIGLIYFAFWRKNDETILLSNTSFMHLRHRSAGTNPNATSDEPWSGVAHHLLQEKPGKGADFTKFRREHTKLILDELKKQGLILDYKWFTKPTTEATNDWDLALALMFRNYAEALDFNEERGNKLNDVTLKHYGTADARTKAGDSQRDLRDVVSSHLVREEMLNPIK